MGDKDIISKRILKNLIRDFAAQLFGLPVTEVELLETQSQRVEERRADLVARVRLPGGEAFLLHIEVQNSNESAMPTRMLRYLTDIMLEYPGLPVRQHLVYIGRERLSMADGLDMPYFSYRYRIIDLHAVDCEEFLRQDSPDAWVLAILCGFGNRLPREVAHAILTRLQQRLGDNPPRLREYVEMLNVLADNRDLNLDIYEELKMLNVNVERLAIYRIGMEKGIEKGIEKGMELGRQAGEREQSLAIAQNLLEMGIGLPQIAAATGLPLAEIEALTAGRSNG
jgi:predicted transposase YdaD